MTRRQRVWAILFLVISLTGLIALSSGISDIALSAEWTLYDFDGDDAKESRSAAQEIINRLPKLPEGIWQVLSVAAVIFVPLSLLVAMFSPEVRKTLFKEVRRVIPFVIFAIIVVYFLNRIQLENLNPADSNLFISPPDMPDWMTNPSAVIAFTIGALTLALIVLASYFIWRYSQKSSLGKIASEAQLTIDQLKAGADYKNSIIECYARMCLVLYEHRRIIRRESMTAREFASHMERLGVSGWHAHRLTKLFESVRYGARELDKRDEKEAIECLTSITQLAEKRSRILSPSTAWQVDK